jgi:hypothetical protein
MIEYTLISSILERICKMTKKPLEYPRDNTKLDSLRHLLEIKTWGMEWKKVIDKTMEWIAWQRANAKMDEESFSIMRQTVNISKDDMEDYNLAMFTHAMDFFKECANLKKSIPKHFFTSLLKNLSTEDLLTLGNLLFTKFINPRQRLYATLGRQAWVPQELKNKVLKQLVNHRMIGPTPKPQDMNDSRKKR